MIKKIIIVLVILFIICGCKKDNGGIGGCSIDETEECEVSQEK